MADLAGKGGALGESPTEVPLAYVGAIPPEHPGCQRDDRHDIGTYRSEAPLEKEQTISGSAFCQWDVRGFDKLLRMRRLRYLTNRGTRAFQEMELGPEFGQEYAANESQIWPQEAYCWR